MVQRKSFLIRLSRTLRHKQTPWEQRLWYYLRNGRLSAFKFKRQVAIGNYIVDFCCNEKKLIIELDGSQHQSSLLDRNRDKFFINLGYEVLRFWNNEVDINIQGVLEKIEHNLYAKVKE